MPKSDGMRGLVDAECGGSNALVGFGNQLTANKRLQSYNGAGSSRHAEFTQQYLSEVGSRSAAPASFSMHSLVSNLPDHQKQVVPFNADAQRWTAEFAASMAHTGTQRHDPWTSEYLAQTQGNPHLTANNWIQQYTGGHTSSAMPQSQWSSEYLQQFDQSKSDDSSSDQAEMWTRQYANEKSAEPLSQDETDTYWSSLQSEWDKMSTMESTNGEYDWLSSPKSIYDEYTAETSNPYLEAANPVAEGQRLMAIGDLANAILHFEAATRKDGMDAQAWRLLGIAQSENECETKAIAALRRSRSLDPRNLDTLFALGVAYTNECLYNDAMKSMAEWLASNPNYSQFAPLDLTKPTSNNINSYTSFMDRDLFNQLEQAYLQSAASQPGQIDAQLQNSLGVLYNIGGNFDRAIDSFQAALQVDAQEARTWNRLGATLANSSSERTAEAINAYSQALQLYPGFVRARCNLAISCLHLKAYPQAVEHFIGALQLQQRGLGPTGERSDMSDSIWQSMRMAALHFPDSSSMLTAIQAHDLDGVQRLLPRASNSHADTNS